MNPQVLNEAKKMIAGFISDRRHALGLSQQALADKAGLGIRTIQRIEAASFIPDGKSLLKLCYALDCYFFFAEKEGDDPVIELMRRRWSRPGDEN